LHLRHPAHQPRLRRHALRRRRVPLVPRRRRQPRRDSQQLADQTRERLDPSRPNTDACRMSDVGVAIGFWSLGALAVGAALGIVLTQNILHAVLFLILSFIAMAGLFVTLSADFVAVAQVLIYAGAV